MFEDWQNVVENPDWVTADRDFALMSAIWFWNKNGLNKFADAAENGESSSFITLTKRINGGTIGLADRQHHYDDALKFLS
jgi:putative chitinase